MLKLDLDIKRRQITTDEIKTFIRNGGNSYYRLLSDYVRMCPVCKRQYDGKAIIPHKINGCYHIICEQCLENKSDCPICNANFDLNMITKAYIPRIKNKFPRLCAQNCSEHSKDFEWFCRNCSYYMCVKCRAQHATCCEIDEIIPLIYITSQTKDLLDKKLQKEFPSFANFYKNLLSTLEIDKKYYLELNRDNESKFDEAKNGFRQNFKDELLEAKNPELKNLNDDYKKTLAANEAQKRKIYDRKKYLKEQLDKLIAIKQQHEKIPKGTAEGFMYMIQNTKNLEEFQYELKDIRDERNGNYKTKTLTADYDYKIKYGNDEELQNVLSTVIYYDKDNWYLKDYHAGINNKANQLERKREDLCFVISQAINAL